MSETEIDSKGLPNASNAQKNIQRIKSAYLTTANSFRKFWKLFRKLSINVGIAIIVLSFVKIVYDDVYRRGYFIKAFNVPEEFRQKGYDGSTTAYLMVDKVNHMISVGNSDRTTKEIEDFNESGQNDQLKLEVGLFGFSSDILTYLFQGTFGRRSKTISGDIVLTGRTLKLMLRITGTPTKLLERQIGETGIEASYEELIQDGAEYILKEANPFLLALFYSKTSNLKAPETFRFAIQRQPEQASDAYSWWANHVYFIERDTSVALPLIRKALEINPDNSNAYRILALTQTDGLKLEQYLKTAIELDPTNISAWVNLGTYYSRDKSTELKAIECFKKCYQLDPTYVNALNWWCDLLILRGEFSEAYEISEKLKYVMRQEYIQVSVPLSILNGDTASASSAIKNGKLDKNEIVMELNDIAFSFELRHKYDYGLKLVEYAIRLDSLSPISAYPYSTRAELYGLLNEDEKFYYNLAMAFKRGYRLPDDFLNIEAYKKFAGEKRFKNLIVTFHHDSVR